MRALRSSAALIAAFLSCASAVEAAPCAGFTDVDDTSPFCVNVAWMRNRAITLGCAATLYCPSDFVTRLQMAAFMYRLGFQNAFLHGGNTFGEPAVIGTLDAEPLVVTINQSPVASFDASGLFVGTGATTGAVAAIRAATNSTSLDATAIRGTVNATTPGGGSTGVVGINNGTNTLGQGLYGEHMGGGFGVHGRSAAGIAVNGFSSSGDGVVGTNGGSGAGVRGGSGIGIGVQANSITGRALVALSGGIGLTNPTASFNNTDLSPGEPGGIAVYARNSSGDATIVTHNTGNGDAIRVFNQAGNAFVFRVSGDGTVRADGSYNCGLASGCFNTGIGADLAERIDATEAMAPGDVVEIDPDAPGHYRRSRSAASTLVAGVVSGRPAITMNNNDLATGSDTRTDARPLIALVGTVEVRASTENGPIRAGDLLVSASTQGTAMRAGERAATGTVIGKALAPLHEGSGTIAMLVMLR